MIVYDKLWITMAEKGISQNRLYKYYKISRSQIHRLKHNQVVYTSTLDRLCNILGCSSISEIVTFIPDKDDSSEDGEK